VDGARKALVIANDEYQDPGLSQLRSPAQDAAALSAVLGDPAIGEFTVEVARNEPSHVVQARIEDFFLDANPPDLLLLHFSCHGVKSESGELYFAATNTRPSRLGSTAVAADFVQRCMRTSRSRSVVLFLDCCYGGAFSRGAAVRATGSVDVLGSFPSDQLGGRGRGVITASSSMEYAFEGDQLADDHAQKPSVFTHALVEGLTTGDADRDEDGLISLNELYDYLFDQVREANPNQTPGRNVELQGEIYIAKSRRRRIHPTPLPADLRAATTDTNLFSRLGAVSELRARLKSGNLGVARAAFDALQEMAGHDIQQVAAAAQVALADAILSPSESRVSFGDLLQGSTASEHTIRLLGPPLACVAAPSTTPAWLRVRHDDDGLHLSVDTSTAGRKTGELTIEGPTGRATVHVDATIVNPSPQPSSPEPSITPEADQAARRPMDVAADAPAELVGVQPVPMEVPAGMQPPPAPAPTHVRPATPPDAGDGQPPSSRTPSVPMPQRPSETAPVNTHLMASVLATIFGLTSFFGVIPGLVAIGYANMARTNLRRGDLAVARKASSTAIVWIWLTIGAWVIFYLAVIIANTADSQY